VSTTGEKKTNTFEHQIGNFREEIQNVPTSGEEIVERKRTEGTNMVRESQGCHGRGGIEKRKERASLLLPEQK